MLEAGFTLSRVDLASPFDEAVPQSFAPASQVLSNMSGSQKQPQYIAYIDEAGDDGHNVVRPIDPSGSSEWLIMGATVIDATREDGWWAPLLIVTARLIQGFSAGGELGAATTFMIEHAADGRRGLAASWQQSSQAATLLAGTLIAASVSGAMSKEAFEAWGWRLPFLIGLLIVPVGLYIRRQIGETPAFTKLGGSNRSNPMVDLVRGHGPQVISGIGLVIVWTVSMYFFVVYMPTYAQRQLGLPQSATLLANGVALVAMIISGTDNGQRLG